MADIESSYVGCMESVTGKNAVWYKQWWGVLIAVGGFGIFIPWYLWKQTVLAKPIKWVLGTLAFVFWITIVAGAPNTSSTETPANTGTPATSNLSATAAPGKAVSYQSVRRDPVPNGGFTQVVAIDPSLVNQSDMEALGMKLREDTKSDRNAFVYVYDAQDAARLRDISLDVDAPNDQASEAAKHLVGVYNKNSASGISQFEICLAGRDGSCSTIRY